MSKVSFNSKHSFPWFILICVQIPNLPVHALYLFRTLCYHTNLTESETKLNTTNPETSLHVVHVNHKRKLMESNKMYRKNHIDLKDLQKISPISRQRALSAEQMLGPELVMPKRRKQRFQCLGCFKSHCIKAGERGMCTVGNQRKCGWLLGWSIIDTQYRKHIFAKVMNQWNIFHCSDST